MAGVGAALLSGRVCWAQPPPRIVLVGRGAGYDEVAAEFGCTVDPGLDLNLVGMPLAGSLLDRAMRADTECVPRREGGGGGGGGGLRARGAKKTPSPNPV